jgi:hypothetical protein
MVPSSTRPWGIVNSGVPRSLSPSPPEVLRDGCTSLTLKVESVLLFGRQRNPQSWSFSDANSYESVQVELPSYKTEFRIPKECDNGQVSFEMHRE